jgi:hypothetical protein
MYRLAPKNRPQILTLSIFCNYGSDRIVIAHIYIYTRYVYWEHVSKNQKSSLPIDCVVNHTRMHIKICSAGSITDCIDCWQICMRYGINVNASSAYQMPY